MSLATRSTQLYIASRLVITSPTPQTVHLMLSELQLCNNQKPDTWDAHVVAHGPLRQLSKNIWEVKSKAPTIILAAFQDSSISYFWATVVDLSGVC